MLSKKRADFDWFTHGSGISFFVLVTNAECVVFLLLRLLHCGLGLLNRLWRNDPPEEVSWELSLISYRDNFWVIMWTHLVL